jgi:hypothetical protein
MAKFLNTSRAYAEIEDIISKAKGELFLISPYIQIPDRLLERLKYADSNNVRITIICREESLKPEEKSNIKQLKHIKLGYLEYLHAKCFYNEESIVITSLNLYDYSQQNNREMGVLLTKHDDVEVFNEALSEAKFIVQTATPENIPFERDSIKLDRHVNSKDSEQKSKASVSNSLAADVGKLVESAFPTLTKMFNLSSKSSRGYCIRCGADIPYNLEKPYCSKHLEKWEEYKNPDYKEKYCHVCGKEHRTSQGKPRCRSCFDKAQK